jgi:large subunit ribosomal protein L7e
MVATKKKSELALIPESVLKKRHDLDELRRKREASATPKDLARKNSNNTEGKKKAFYVKKPETFIAHARSRRNNEIRYNRVLKKGMQKRASDKKQVAVREIDQEGESMQVEYQKNSVSAPMVFAVRIRDHVGAPSIVKTALSRLRLREKDEGVFLRYDESCRKLLHLVEPWVVYGRPSKAVVQDLVERRGFGKVGGKRVPLSDNTVVEENLGEHHIICVEDLVHELYTVGDSFKHAAAFLWPFRLADSKTSFERRTLGLKDGKDYGDRGELINEYIKQVL